MYQFLWFVFVGFQAVASEHDWREQTKHPIPAERHVCCHRWHHQSNIRGSSGHGLHCCWVSCNNHVRLYCIRSSWSTIFVAYLACDISWFRDFFYKSPFASKFPWKKRRSHQGKKEVACIVSNPLVSCLWGCGESVNPPKVKHPGDSGGFVLLTKERLRPATHFQDFLLLLNHIMKFVFVYSLKKNINNVHLKKLSKILTSLS